MSLTVLVTGAFGYLGGRIASYLALQPDMRVLAASRTPPATKPDWLSAGDCVRVGLDDPESLREACRGVDAVVHLAAVNEVVSARDPETALRVNGLGSLAMLRAAKAAGVGRFVYFSTAHVYGAPLAGRIDESRLPRPVHPYAITHRTAEDFVLAAHDAGELTGIALRLSNGVGAPVHPRVDRWTLLANDLCRQAVTEGALTLRSSGVQRRDFIALADVERAVHHVLRLPREACGDGLFNLGGGQSLAVRELALRIAERARSALDAFLPLNVPDPAPGEQAPDLDYRSDRLAATGFAAVTPLDLEIDRMLRFCAQHFDGRTEHG